MARRGITYGQRLVHPDTQEFIDHPNDGVGLLFMSYQASIENQFRFMQTQWANNANFPSAGVGIDPIIGQGTGAPVNHNWPDPWGQATSPQPFPSGNFVHLKGGEYLYAPSLSGLKAI
jgi:hypothetical protein